MRGKIKPSFHLPVMRAGCFKALCSIIAHWAITPVAGESGQAIFKLVTVEIPVTDIYNKSEVATRARNWN